MDGVNGEWMSIESSQFVKNVDKVKALIRKNGSGAVVANGPLKLYVPARFEQKNLVVIKDKIRVLACFALVVEDKYYAADNGTVMIETQPTHVNRLQIDEEDYIEFVYEKGDLILVDPSGLKDKDAVHPIGKEILGNGRVPWYLEVSDIVTLNPNFERYNSVNLATDLAIYELMVSLMMRDPQDVNQPYRTSKAAKVGEAPTIVGTSQVELIVHGTMAKLGGPYLNGNITGALQTESESISEIEYLQRI